MDIDTDPIPAVIAPTPPNMDTEVKPQKKRRRSRGPAQATRHAAFLASKQQADADGAQALMDTDARGDDGGGV